jgi:hypothetical protein
MLALLKKEYREAGRRVYSLNDWFSQAGTVTVAIPGTVTDKEVPLLLMLAFFREAQIQR